MSKARIRLPFSIAVRMIGDYASVRLRSQLKSVAFIVVYLVAFQLLVFGKAPAEAFRIAGGIAIVVLGLALFLEGILLGLMPLAERVGIQLPSRGGLNLIVPMGLLLGLGSTFAEPAVAALRTVGGDIPAWEAPLLFFLLERRPQLLIAAIGIGVGAAVAIGMVRFYVGFSIKPVILCVIPVLLLLTALFAMSDNLASILGLAWDAGAVTTGPVTVPLVLALGIGVSRASGKTETTGSGFGVVMLASAMPVLAVMVLGGVLQSGLPGPTSEEQFFSPEHREQALLLFADEAELKAHASRHASPQVLDALSFTDQPDSDGNLPVATLPPDFGNERAHFGSVLLHEALFSARAVLPFVALLGLVLFLLGDRPRYLDEVALGVFFALVGMAFLASGMRLGLGPLGSEAGGRLPQVYQEKEVERGVIVVEDFDLAVVFPAVAPSGETVQVFNLYDGEEVQTVLFRPEWHDPESQTYTHRIRTSPLTVPGLSRIGLLLVFLFAFGMGYGATVAEPALNALGRTVEDFTVGTVKGVSVVRAVSLGVGIGMVVGVLRILFGLPTAWIVLPPYLLLLPLTLLIDEDFAGIAWDTGGVTTGPVTVPLVMAMGLGLGGQLDIADGFGILAMASVYPIVAVLLFGLFVRMRQRKMARAAEGVDSSA